MRSWGTTIGGWGLSLDLRRARAAGPCGGGVRGVGHRAGLAGGPGAVGRRLEFQRGADLGERVRGRGKGLLEGGTVSLQDYAGVGPQRVGAGWRPDSMDLRVQARRAGAAGGGHVPSANWAWAAAGYHDTRLGFRFEGAGGLGGGVHWSDGMRFELRLEQQVSARTEAVDYGLFMDVSGRF